MVSSNSTRGVVLGATDSWVSILHLRIGMEELRGCSWWSCSVHMRWHRACSVDCWIHWFECHKLVLTAYWTSPKPLNDDQPPTKKKVSLLQPVRQADRIDEKGLRISWGCVSPMTLYGRTCISTEAVPQSPNTRLISRFLEKFSEIWVKRADTTFYLSHKGKESVWEKRSKSCKKRRYLYSRQRR